jgi:hypothetical protein
MIAVISSIHVPIARIPDKIFSAIGFIASTNATTARLIVGHMFMTNAIVWACSIVCASPDGSTNMISDIFLNHPATFTNSVQLTV